MVAHEQDILGFPAPNDSIAGGSPIPTRWAAFLFRLKVLVFRIKRVVAERRSGRPPRHANGASLTLHPVLARSETPLWNASVDQVLIRGKVHNLRQAVRTINGLEVAPGQVFSFWRQLGKPTRLRGFVKGRELRQGCLIASTGGGLCQLSNALYECALRSGFKIVERHAHSKIVPGSRAELDLDATVFWNYVDLRFESPRAFRIEAYLTADSLVIQFKGEMADNSPDTRIRPAPPPSASAGAPLPILNAGPAAPYPSIQLSAPHNCAECGVASCFRSEPRDGNTKGRTAFLLDSYSPEFDEYVQSVRTGDDVLALPIDGKRFGKRNYAWTTDGFGRVRTAAMAALRRAVSMRNLPAQGASLQRALMRGDEWMARRFARLLTQDITHVVLSQNLLLPLWRAGHLGGRTFDVLATRLPMRELEQTLDFAQRLHPESRTLSDYRAHPELTLAEAEAHDSARRIVTPNAALAHLFGTRAVLLNWQLPHDPGKLDPPVPASKPRAVLFPSSTLARKGAYELRAAARALDIEVVLMGPVLEDPDFWRGIRVRQAGSDWLEGIGVVCLPAFVGQNPRRLLEAVGRGVPVIATAACGLDGLDRVITVPPGDTGALIREIGTVLVHHSVMLESLCFA